jgi:hypothetical protein
MQLVAAPIGVGTPRESGKDRDICAFWRSLSKSESPSSASFNGGYDRFSSRFRGF